MICKQCKNEIADGALVCPICSYTAQLNEERDKLTALKDRQSGLLRSLCHSGIFLALTVCFSIVAAATLLSVVQGNPGDILPGIFMVVSCVGLWRSYFAKENRGLADAISSASLYDGYLGVIYIIVAACDLLATLGGATLAFLVYEGHLLESFTNNNQELRDIALVLTVAGLIFGFALCGVMIAMRFVFARRRKYFLNLAKFAREGAYTPEKPSAVGSYIVGAVNLLGGAVALILSLASTGLISLITSVLGAASSAGGEEIAQLISAGQAVVNSAIGTMAISGGARAALGLYYILSARFMKSVDSAAMALRSEIEHQNVFRLDLERRTKAELERVQQIRAEQLDMSIMINNAEPADDNTATEATEQTTTACEEGNTDATAEGEETAEATSEEAKTEE